MAADITYKKSGNKFYKVVEDGYNSLTVCIQANENEFKGIYATNEDTFGYETIHESEWMDLLDSYNDVLVYALEFIGGHPPHMPPPNRPK